MDIGSFASGALARLTENMDIGSFASGALGGAISSTLAIFLLAPARERQRLWLNSSHVAMEALSPDSGQHYRFLVQNLGTETIVDAIAYVTLNNTGQHILEGRHAFEAPGHAQGVRNGRLCWALAGNPHKVDIFPGEKQLLNFAQVVSDRDGLKLVIASELGFGDDKEKPARVLLAPQRYSGAITLVSKNTLARVFDIEIVIANSAFGRASPPRARRFAKKWRFIATGKNPAIPSSK